MSKGTVSIPTGSELGEYSWEGTFPGEFQQNSEMQRGAWRAPKEYQDIFNDWKDQGTPLRLMVTGYPINKDVHLQKFTAEAAGAFGGLDYEVAFIEDRDITISSSAQASTQTPKRAGDPKRRHLLHREEGGHTVDHRPAFLWDGDQVAGAVSGQQGYH